MVVSMMMFMAVMSMMIIAILIFIIHRDQVHVTYRAVSRFIVHFITLTFHWTVVLNLTVRLSFVFRIFHNS